LAVLAEYEIAERETRRIQRHLNESKLLGGKTLATYQFEAMPSLPKAHIEALAGGDWIVITRLAPPAAVCPNGLRHVHSDVANDVSEMEGACGVIYSGSSGGVVGVIKISC
jgi:hypothetical protein